MGGASMGSKAMGQVVEAVKPDGQAGASRLDQFVCFSIYAANHALNRAYKPLLDALGLTYPQYIVMVVLWEQDQRTVSEIGAALYLESNTLTPILKRMQGMGLVSRSRSEADERQVIISLTGAGRALQAKAATVPDCILKASGMDADDLMRLNAMIRTLNHNLRR
jgi:DNA-binding MarR family transcriptional regulator